MFKIKRERNSNKLLSIIIPIYNTSSYLEKCIQSVAFQTYENIEILLVNDGSTDDSLSICFTWEKKDARIQVYNKENGGLSDARNYGILKAKGDYILLLDSDDYYDEDACQKISEKVNKDTYDMITINMKLVYDNRMVSNSSKINIYEKTMSGRSFLKEKYKDGSMQMAAVLNVYRRDFLLNNELFFKKGILHEDEEFTPRAFLKAEKVIAIDTDFYNYYIRDDSITNNKNLYKNVKDLYETLAQLDKIYSKLDDDELKALAKESLLEKYLYMFSKARVYQKEYDSIRNKGFVKGKAISKRNKLKVTLFTISTKLYCFINRASK